MAGNKLLSLLFSIAIISMTHNVTAQSNDSVNHRRLNGAVIGTTVGYTATYAGLYQLWYRNSDHQSFQFFNDNREWKQVDKLGHFYSSFYFTCANARLFRWTGLSEKRSDLIGSLTGFLVIAPIEIFDGYSARYGASSGDLIADAAGPLFYYGQKALWSEIRLIPKFSYHETAYAPLRPEILGDSPVSRLLKDYNGQTYWLCADMDKFMKFPKWLNLAAGYGAQAMVYGRERENQAMGYSARRQFYLSVDIDLSSVRTRSKLVKTLIFIANTVKIPAPAIEFSRGNPRFHPFYF